MDQCDGGIKTNLPMNRGWWCSWTLFILFVIPTTVTQAFVSIDSHVVRVLPNTIASSSSWTTKGTLLLEPWNRNGKISRKSSVVLQSSVQSSTSSSTSSSSSHNVKKLEHIEFDQVNARLHEIVQNQSKEGILNDNDEHEHEPPILAIQGYITHRRSFGSNLAFIDLVSTNNGNGNDNGNGNTPNTTSSPPLQALLKRQEYQQDSSSSSSSSSFKAILKSLYPGTKVYMEGHASTTKNPGEVVLMVTHVTFLGLSRNTEHVKGVLQRIHLDEEEDREGGGGDTVVVDGLSLEEICKALNGLDPSIMRQVLNGEKDVEALFEESSSSPSLEQTNAPPRKENDEDDNTKRWNSKRIAHAKIAKVILNHLPPDPNYPSNILATKGKSPTSRNKDGTPIQQYASLPTAPLAIYSVPSSIHDSCTPGETLYSSDIVTDGGNDYSKVNTLLQNPQLDIQQVTIAGWVQNRRRFQGEINTITVLEIVDEFSSATDSNDNDADTDGMTNRLKCILHPSCMNPSGSGVTGPLSTDVYGYLLSQGARVLLQGYFGTTDHGTKRPFLWVTNARLMRCSWRPSIIRHLLSLLSNEKSDHDDNKNHKKIHFDCDEIADAFDLAGGYTEAQELKAECATNGVTEKQWRAAEISRRLQDGNSRMGGLSDEMLAILDKYSSDRDKWSLEHVEYKPLTTIVGNSGGSTSRTAPDEGEESALRASREGSRWQRAKRPQLEWMAHQIGHVVRSHPDFGTRRLNILDVGGGRGHLANFLASAIGEDTVNIHVIDIDRRTVNNGMLQAQRRSLGVRYAVGDASSSSTVTSLLEGFENDTKGIDIVVALHACGALSDVALGHATSHDAAFVITPCCYRSNSHLRVSIRDNDTGGIVEARPASWLGLKSLELEALNLIAERQGDIGISSKAAHTICALRANAVLGHHSLASMETISDRGQLELSIKTFPIGFSTRNLCLVGKVRAKSTTNAEIADMR